MNWLTVRVYTDDDIKRNYYGEMINREINTEEKNKRRGEEIQR